MMKRDVELFGYGIGITARRSPVELHRDMGPEEWRYHSSQDERSTENSILGGAFAERALCDFCLTNRCAEQERVHEFHVVALVGVLPAPGVFIWRRMSHGDDSHGERMRLSKDSPEDPHGYQHPLQEVIPLCPRDAQMR